MTLKGFRRLIARLFASNPFARASGLAINIVKRARVSWFFCAHAKMVKMLCSQPRALTSYRQLASINALSNIFLLKKTKDDLWTLKHLNNSL